MKNELNTIENDGQSNIDSTNFEPTVKGNKKPYVSPKLTSFGDVRDVTLGPTVGFGESGGGPFCAEGVNCP